MKVFQFTEEEYSALVEDVAQLRTEFEALRLQVLPDATPVAEEVMPPLIGVMEGITTSNVIPIAHNSIADTTNANPLPEEEKEATRVKEAQRQVEEADAAHLAMNTKEIPQQEV